MYPAAIGPRYHRVTVAFAFLFALSGVMVLSGDTLMLPIAIDSACGLLVSLIRDHREPRWLFNGAMLFVLIAQLVEGDLLTILLIAFLIILAQMSRPLLHK